MVECLVQLELWLELQEQIERAPLNKTETRGIYSGWDDQEGNLFRCKMANGDRHTH